jgi:hypothetical protein
MEFSDLRHLGVVKGNWGIKGTRIFGSFIIDQDSKKNPWL